MGSRNIKTIKIVAGALALALALAGAANAGCKIVQLAEWPVSHANNRPLVDGKINGQPVKVLIDTGANATFMWRWTADAFGLPLSGAEGVRIFGAGGEAQIAATMVKELEIGAYRANSTRLVVMGSDHEKPQESGLVLGDEFFSSFSTEFDIAHGFVRLLRPEGCKADQLAYWSDTYSLAELQPTAGRESPYQADRDGERQTRQCDFGYWRAHLDVGRQCRRADRHKTGSHR